MTLRQKVKERGRKLRAALTLAYDRTNSRLVSSRKLPKRMKNDWIVTGFIPGRSHIKRTEALVVPFRS